MKKKTIFYLLLPFYATIGLFLLWSFKWWEKDMLDDHIIIFLMLLPFYLIFGLFMYLTYDWYCKLLED